jgi:tetratricopeptide (TPR) repeat protein
MINPRITLMIRNPTAGARCSLIAPVALAVVALSACGRVPEPAVPANLDGLDPAVAELIRSQLQVVANDPDDGAAHGELGLIYAANNLWDPARAALTVAADLDDDYLWRYYRAMAVQQTGDVAAAVAAFEGLAAIQPDFAPMLERLGDLQLASGDLQAAERSFRRVIELEPESPEGYAGLGEALLAGGDAAGAATALEAALVRDAAHRVAHHVLGNAYRHLGRVEEGARHLALGTPATRTYLSDPYAARLERYRVDFTAQTDRGVALMAAGDLREAERVFRQTLKDHPDNLTLLNNLAIALMRQNRLDESRAVLEQALAVDDGKFSTYSNLAAWALRKRDSQLALQYATQAVERAPDRSQTWFLKGRILLSMEQYEEAAAALEKSAELNYRNVDAHIFLGEAMIRLARWGEAREAFAAALQVNPEQLRAHAGLVRVGIADGQLELAAYHLAILKLYTPDHPEVAHFQEQLDAAAR